jgi:Pyruvate/2-oxoacid:ferredoxin oxidoreductase delta subunit
VTLNAERQKLLGKRADLEKYLARPKESFIPETPDVLEAKKKKPPYVAVVDENMCYPCGKCPEFCPVGCIEYLPDGTHEGRGLQPVQVRLDECIGCWICVEVCAVLTDYDAIRMYPTKTVEEVLGRKMSDKFPQEIRPVESLADHFSEDGSNSLRHLGQGSRVIEKVVAKRREYNDILTQLTKA